MLSVDFLDTLSSTKIEVYDDCADVVCRAQTIGGQKSLQVSLSAGSNIFIHVTSHDPHAHVYYRMEIYEPVQPANDACHEAKFIDVRRLPYTETASNLMARTSTAVCGNPTKINALYYIMSPNSRQYFVHTCGRETDFVTSLEILQGCEPTDPNNCIADDDSANRCLRGREMVISGMIGQERIISVGQDRLRPPFEGVFRITFLEAVAPKNSDCLMATEFDGDSIFTGQTYKTKKSTSTCSPRELSRNGVWYKHHASRSLMMYLTTCFSDTTFQTQIEVYTTCDGTGQADRCFSVSSNEECAGSYTRFVTQPGETYYIFVTGETLSDTGLFKFSAQFSEVPIPPPPPPPLPPKDGGFPWSIVIFGVLIAIAMVFVISLAVAFVLFKSYKSKSATSRYTLVE